LLRERDGDFGLPILLHGNLHYIQKTGVKSMQGKDYNLPAEQTPLQMSNNKGLRRSIGVKSNAMRQYVSTFDSCECRCQGMPPPAGQHPVMTLLEPSVIKSRQQTKTCTD
jgi:hypothetical protein